MKRLVIQLVDGVYYVSDRSFRSRIGVPLICKKTILAKCILNDAHADLGHVRDVPQVLTHIQTTQQTKTCEEHKIIWFISHK